MGLNEAWKRRTSFSVPLSLAAQLEPRMPRTGSFGCLPDQDPDSGSLSDFEGVSGQSGSVPGIGMASVGNRSPTLKFYYDRMPIGRTESSAGEVNCFDLTEHVPFVYNFDRAECLEPVRSVHNSLTKGEAEMTRYLVGEFPTRSSERGRHRQPHCLRS